VHIHMADNLPMMVNMPLDSGNIRVYLASRVAE